MAWGHRTEADIGHDQGGGANFRAGPPGWPVADPTAPDPAARDIILDLRPTVLVAGRASETAQLATWAERAGLRCIGQIEPAALAQRLAMIVAVDMILVDLRGACSTPGLDCQTTRMLSARPGLDGARLAIITDLAGLDWAIARLDAPDAEFLCEPQPADIVSLLVMAALGAEARTHGVRFQDAARDGEAARIDRLSEEVRRLAATIERLTRDRDETITTVMEPRGTYREASQVADVRPDPRSYAGHGHAPHSAANAGTADHGDIRALLRARRMREQFLPADLFADPAWDMMLDLMAARLCGQRVSVSSLCIAAAVPPTTALRWIRQLTERAVFARIDDPADGRRVFIELTDTAADALTGWALAVRKSGGLLASSARP